MPQAQASRPKPIQVRDLPIKIRQLCSFSHEQSSRLLLQKHLYLKTSDSILESTHMFQVSRPSQLFLLKCVWPSEADNRHDTQTSTSAQVMQGKDLPTCKPHGGSQKPVTKATSNTIKNNPHFYRHRTCTGTTMQLLRSIPAITTLRLVYKSLEKTASVCQSTRGRELMKSCHRTGNIARA